MVCCALGTTADVTRAGIVVTVDYGAQQDNGYSATHNFGQAFVNATLTANRFQLRDIGGMGGNSNPGVKITTSGHATASPVGTNAFSLTQGQTTNSLVVGVNTSSAGNRSGTVTVDSTPPNDAHEVYNVQAQILDRSNASFSTLNDVNVLNVDFGSFSLGGGQQSLGLTLANLVATADFTAGLDLLSLSGSGDTGILTTDLTSFTNQVAGSSRNFNSFFDLGTVGAFSATYLLNLSDRQSIAGALGQTLTLNLSGEVVAPSVAAVPEPSTLAMGTLGVAIAGIGYARRRRNVV